MTRQVNNLKIKYNRANEKWEVWTPDGRCWEEFDSESEAVAWAQGVHDFLSEHARKRMYGR